MHLGIRLLESQGYRYWTVARALNHSFCHLTFISTPLDWRGRRRCNLTELNRILNVAPHLVVSAAWQGSSVHVAIHWECEIIQCYPGVRYMNTGGTNICHMVTVNN